MRRNVLPQTRIRICKNDLFTIPSYLSLSALLQGWFLQPETDRSLFFWRQVACVHFAFSAHLFIVSHAENRTFLVLTIVIKQAWFTKPTSPAGCFHSSIHAALWTRCQHSMHDIINRMVVSFWIRVRLAADETRPSGIGLKLDVTNGAFLRVSGFVPYCLRLLACNNERATVRLNSRLSGTHRGVGLEPRIRIGSNDCRMSVRLPSPGSVTLILLSPITRWASWNTRSRPSLNTPPDLPQSRFVMVIPLQSSPLFLKFMHAPHCQTLQSGSS